MKTGKPNSHVINKARYTQSDYVKRLAEQVKKGEMTIKEIRVDNPTLAHAVKQYLGG